MRRADHLWKSRTRYPLALRFREAEERMQDFEKLGAFYLGRVWGVPALILSSWQSIRSGSAHVITWKKFFITCPCRCRFGRQR